MIRKTIYLLVFTLLAGLPGPVLAEGGKIVLNTGVRAPFTTEDRQGFLDLLVKEAFRRIGLDAEIAVYDASARSLKAANDGIDDGLTLRIAGLEKKYPNLIRVPEKIMDNDFVAYSFGKDVETKDWHSLDGHSIAYILGWQIFDKGLGHHKDVTQTKDAEQLFDVFKAKRVDFVLYERWQGLWRAKSLNLKVKVHEPPLASVEMFIYLHRKHQPLVDKVAKALAEMKKDGTYQQIHDRALGSLSGGPAAK